MPTYLAVVVRLSLLTLALGSAGTKAVFAADPSASDRAAATRTAITLALPTLAKEGAEWMSNRKCLSCHHVPMLLWTHHAARAQGFEIDLQKLAEWENWAASDSLQRRNHFKLSADAIKKLADDNIAEGVREQLTKLADKSFVDEAAFTAALQATLDALPEKAQLAAIVARAKLPLTFAVNDGGGTDTMAELLVGSLSAASDAKSGEIARFVRETPALFGHWQEASGRWRTGDQHRARLWSDPEEPFQVTTAWTLLALAGDDDADTSDSRPTTVSSWIDQGRRYLAQAKPRSSTEWHLTRMLVAQRFNEQELLTKLRADLLKQQNDDGGWGVLPGQPSQAWSTGEAMYALRQTGSTRDDPQLVRAQQYLLDTQRDDGTWLCEPERFRKPAEAAKLKRLVPIFGYWVNAWGTLGLLQML